VLAAPEAEGRACYICTRPTLVEGKPPICSGCRERLQKDGFGKRFGHDPSVRALPATLLDVRFV
jgi:hypothetical protein